MRFEPPIYSYIEKMTEVKLIEECRKGSETAYKMLVETYSKQMMGICYRYIGDEEIAKELLYDGFMKVFSFFHSFQYRGEGALKAWMSRIFINTALEYLRRSQNKIEEVPLDSIDDIDNIPEEVSAEMISNDEIMQMVTELPQGYRTVFNMYVVDELSHKEIALKLGINEVSSRSQLHRAKKMLADKIMDYLRRE